MQHGKDFIDKFIADCNKDPRILIDGFFGDYRWLSNFHLTTIKYEDMIYHSSEAAYQAAKTLDIKEREKFQTCSPGETKKLGKSIALRSDWESVKLSVMETILREKFKNPFLKKLLIETGNAILVEGNWWGDQYWGVCNCVGLNNLGKLLMKIREDLRKK